MGQREDITRPTVYPLGVCLLRPSGGLAHCGGSPIAWLGLVVGSEPWLAGATLFVQRSVAMTLFRALRPCHARQTVDALFWVV